MAGVLNLTAAPTFSPLSRRSTSNHRLFSVKSSGNTSESPLSVQTEADHSSGNSVSAPPNFRAPQPKPFSVRPDKVLDILGASLALIFRLTTIANKFMDSLFQLFGLDSIRAEGRGEWRKSGCSARQDKKIMFGTQSL